MKDIKDVLIEMITEATNEIVAISKKPEFNSTDVLPAEFYNYTERERKELNSKIAIIAKAIGATDFIYYPHNNSIEFTFIFDDYASFVRREAVSISNLENYISRF